MLSTHFKGLGITAMYFQDGVAIMEIKSLLSKNKAQKRETSILENGQAKE